MDAEKPLTSALTRLSRIVLGLVAILGGLAILTGLGLGLIFYLTLKQSEWNRGNASAYVDVDFPCAVELTIQDGAEHRTKLFDKLTPGYTWDASNTYQQRGAFTVLRVRVLRDGKEQNHEPNEQVPTGAQLTIRVFDDNISTSTDYDAHM